jgi:hypothetical protein
MTSAGLSRPGAGPSVRGVPRSGSELICSAGARAGVGFEEGVATTLGLGGGFTMSFRTDGAEALDGVGTNGAVGNGSFGCSSVGTGTGGITGTLGGALVAVPRGTPPSPIATTCPPGSLRAGGGSSLRTWVAISAPPRLRGGSGSSSMAGSRGRSLGPPGAGRPVVARSEETPSGGLVTPFASPPEESPPRGPGAGAGRDSGAGQGAAGPGASPVALAAPGGSRRVTGGGEAVTGRARGAGLREGSEAPLEAGTWKALTAGSASMPAAPSGSSAVRSSLPRRRPWKVAEQARARPR